MKNRQRQRDTLFSVTVFLSAFAVNLLIQKLFTTQTLVPMIFVFGVFLISLKTHGYGYGIVSAIVSVFAVNFAFTYPYYAFDFFVEESILSAAIMLIVAVSTSALNIRIRDQELLRVREQEKLALYRRTPGHWFGGCGTLWHPSAVSLSQSAGFHLCCRNL